MTSKKPWKYKDGLVLCETTEPLDAFVANVVPPWGSVNAEENGRLIAAAPDMLEALRQAAFAIPTDHGAFEKVRKALAKADGK